ncbi:MAG: SHOCT domain-containing protein [Candidatus Hodarchaeales archaeon]|jgi:hypothetical protein
MSELVKLAYRGFGGFIAVVLMFSFGVTAFALFMAGVGVIIGAVYVLINPTIINDWNFNFAGSHITDPLIISLTLLFVTILLFALASLFVGLVLLIGKSALALDQELGKIVDKSIPPLATTIKGDKYHQLERLGNLKQQGIITEDEFNKEKAKLLQE